MLAPRIALLAFLTALLLPATALADEPPKLTTGALRPIPTTAPAPATTPATTPAPNTTPATTTAPATPAAPATTTAPAATPTPPLGALSPTAAAPAGSAAPGAPTSRPGVLVPARPGVLVAAGTPGPGAAVASPTGEPTPTGTPTATPTPSATPIAYPTFAPSHGAVKGHVEGTRLLLEVPIRSQFDGSEYQDSNCGPTALAMVLDAFAVDVKTPLLRNYANRLQGTTDKDEGIALDYLAAIAEEAGLRPLGLRAPSGYRAWTVEQIRAEVGQGHPVITLVKLRLLPYFASSGSDSDHYVVVAGLDGENLLVNDPALPAALGLRRTVTPAELEAAWKASSIPAQAVAIAAGSGVPELKLPVPTPPPPPGSSKVAGRTIAPDADPLTGQPLWPEPRWTIERANFELYNAAPQPDTPAPPDASPAAGSETSAV